MNCEWIKKISGEEEQIRLICLPHAGAGGIIYMPWKGVLSEKIGLYTVLLPGREKRIREPLISDAVVLCRRILEGIKEELKPPYVLFGHSMGGILVYELMRQILAQGLPLPQKIVMAGTSLRGFRRVPNVDLLSDDELADFLVKMGGTEEELLYNENFRACFYPIIKNDYRLVRGYSFEPMQLPVPVIAMAGSRDEEVEIENMYYFQELTDDFKLFYVEGNHFFIENAQKVCAILEQELRVGRGENETNNQLLYQFNKLTEEKKQEFLLRLRGQGEKYGIFPLTNLQKSLLFFYLTKREDTSYHIRWLIHFSKELEVTRLEKAVNRAIRQNPSLRTKLLVLQEEYFQIVESCEEMRLYVTGCKNRQEVDADLQKEETRYFDLEKEFPIRFRLYRTADNGEYLLSVCIHHMFGDGWSVELLSKELKENYVALRYEKSNETPVAKKEYYKCFQTDERAECRQFWQKYLKNGSPRLNFPGEMAPEEHAKALKKTYSKSLADKEELEQLAKEYSVSVYCLTLGIYVQALQEWCGQKSVGVGIAAWNRHTPEEIENMGLYANTLPVISTCDEEFSMEEFYQRLKTEVNSILEYSGTDITHISRLLGFVGEGEDSSMYQTVFLSTEKFREKEKLEDGWMYLENLENSNRIQFDLICALEREQNRYTIRFDYRDLVLKEKDIIGLGAIYEKVFARVKSHQSVLPPAKEVVQAEHFKQSDRTQKPFIEATEEFDAVVGQIRAVWESILPGKDFSVDDNFFTIGGNSLLCIKMVSRLNAALERKIKVTDIFKCYTIRKLAEFLTGAAQKETVNVIQM